MSHEDNHTHVEPSGASDESLQQVHDQLQQKTPESPGGFSPFPLIVLALMCIAIYFGALYFAKNSARLDASIYNEHQLPGTTVVAETVVTPAMLGKRLFTANCIACHQVTGLGMPGVFPPLAGSEWAQGPEERIIRIVLHGVSGPINVTGKDFNNTMTPFGSILKDEQIANVLTYVRQEWGNKAPPVTPEAVAKIRAETASHSGPWSPAELLQIAK